MRQIHIVMNALEDAAMMRQDVYLLFVDFSSAFNTINHDQLLQIMCNLGFTHDAVRVIRDLYTGAQTRIKTPFGTSDPIDFERGTIQGDSLSPFLFLICIEPLLRWLHVGGRGYKHGCIADEKERLRTAATNPAFADDLAILTNNLRDLCTQADKISKYLEWSGLQINPSKCAVTGMLHADPGQSPLSNRTVRMLLDRLATAENGDGFMYMDRVHRWARLHSKHNLITEFYEREPIDQIVYQVTKETSPLEGRAHVYDRAGHWLGKVTLEQLINLRTRFERTHQRDPKLFAKLNCACDRQGVATELALLLQRWQATAKSLSEAALRQQHGTAHPRIVQALQETLGIDTELFAGPLHLHPQTDYYYSTDPRDQLFGAQLDAFSHRWEGRCFAHPPHHQEDLVLRWAVSSARATQRPVLPVLLLPGHHLTKAGRYACQPEVSILGELSGLSLFLPADSTQSRERGHCDGSLLNSTFTLAVVANTSGHSCYDAERVCRKLKEACRGTALHASMSLITSRSRSKVDSNNTRNTPYDGCNEAPALHAPRRFKVSSRRIYPVDPKMRLQTAADVGSAAESFVEHFSHDLPLAYDPALAVYTNGSLQEQKEGPPLLGAGIYRPETDAHEPMYYLINPNGRGPTKTINRAELCGHLPCLTRPPVLLVRGAT
ncbi:hypothetical protein N2152v2_009917 [Parachlorella kessleri]